MISREFNSRKKHKLHAFGIIRWVLERNRYTSFHLFILIKMFVHLDRRFCKSPSLKNLRDVSHEYVVSLWYILLFLCSWISRDIDTSHVLACWSALAIFTSYWVLMWNWSKRNSCSKFDHWSDYLRLNLILRWKMIMRFDIEFN